MEKHTVDKQTMEALKALSETNLKVSAARVTLTQLEEKETEYLVMREGRALARIQKVHDDSAGLLKETQDNFVQAEGILKIVAGACEFIDETNATFDRLLAAFDERDKAWTENCERWEAEATEKRRLLAIEKVKIDNAKESVEKSKEALKIREKQVKDREETVERTITRLNQGKI